MNDQTGNHLIHETSPYLLQHAHNPVDWYAWGSEALDRARVENRPILLSIGYSACHWCHVMERESFENEQIAALMNEHFVNIKVDREERPDLDHIYQTAVQLLTGQGGWPLTMFLTPEQEPFYGGTYFPPDDRYGRPGFPRLLHALADAYHNRQQDVAKSTGEIREAMQKLSGFHGDGGDVSQELVTNAVRNLASNVDMVHGGFGSQPKFPNPTNLDCLLRYWHYSGNENFLNVVKLSLDKMANGGIYDQLGGGFHRYSVDDHWLVPHFEKMLYDNAQLLSLYVAMYRITGEARYACVAREVLDYVQREMRHPEGGFYATQDADSEGEEGKFFVWTKAEVDERIGDDSRLFCRYYDVTEAGNWESGSNILHLTVSLQQLANLCQTDVGTAGEKIEAARRALFLAREQRIKPFRDEKILTAWNGLMLSGMIDAATALGDGEAMQTVRQTISFLHQQMLRDGVLLRSHKDGQSKLAGYLDDYAFLAAALLDAFEATFEPSYFDLARQLTATLLLDFWDDVNGGFFFTGTRHETLIDRVKSGTDQAIPSGTAVATRNLLRLYAHTGEADYLHRAERVLRLYRRHMEQQPFGYGSLVGVCVDYLHKPQEIVLIGDPDAPDTKEMLDAVYRSYVPYRTLIQIDPQRLEPFLAAPPLLRDVLAGKTQVDGKATVYVCHDFTCSLPVTEPAELSALLNSSS